MYRVALSQSLFPAQADTPFRPTTVAAMLRGQAQAQGDVRVRVTIGTNGRVIAVQMLSATSDAFWRVTERQALTRWRFRPATVDGRPVESTKLMNLHFQIQDA